MRQIRRDEWNVTIQNLGTDTVDDEFGNPIEQYDEAFTIRASLSVGSGNAYGSPFGWNMDYDKSMTVSKDYGINEYTKVFITQGGFTKEYKVVAVGISKNIYRYALRYVDTAL